MPAAQAQVLGLDSRTYKMSGVCCSPAIIPAHRRWRHGVSRAKEIRKMS